MPLKKLQMRSGVNRENTRYTNENGWYDCDKIRFRQGTPEKIGGWERLSAFSFTGICRSLWAWATLASQSLMGVGTHLKFNIEQGGVYYDITPLRATTLLGSGAFSTTAGSPVVTVTDATAGYLVNDFVSFTNTPTVDSLTLSGNYQITAVSGSTYTIRASANATTTTTGGGTGIYAMYEAHVGNAVDVPLYGWSAGTWSAGAWGVGGTSSAGLRLWSQHNFGQDLMFGPKGGAIYYWSATIGVNPRTVSLTIASPAVVTAGFGLVENMAITLTTTGVLPTGLVPGTVYYTVNVSGVTANLAATPGGTPIVTTGTQSGVHAISPRAVLLTSLSGATSVPLFQNALLVSDASRITLAFGTNDIGSSTIDPMLIRWADAENAVSWYPQATNQAGSIRLSHGSRIVAAQQRRQEIIVWTDSSLYSMQYIGAPEIWSSQLMADTLSIVSPNAAVVASGITYWMGIDKFYKYDGQVSTLKCDLRNFVFQDINITQFEQVFAGTNESFNEVWWFYCAANTDRVGRYVVYNYAEQVWYYGTMERTAWLNTGLRHNPLAATYSSNIVAHELGVDDNETAVTKAIDSFVQSSEFDIDDGHNFGFVWRMLPDVTFLGSEVDNPTLTMTLTPLKDSGSGYTTPPSVGGVNAASVTRSAVVPVEAFTGQVYVRVRGRQMTLNVRCAQIGATWQLGSPRIDIRPDGRR